MARTIVPSAAAAVDHTDTELIGHHGLETPGFFVVVWENDFPPLRLLPPAPEVGSERNETKREQL